MLSIKEAVARAKAHAIEVFGGDQIADILLEEVDFQNGIPDVWLVTVSFLRTELPPGAERSTLSSVIMSMRSSRIFKIVQINAETGELLRITNRSNNKAA